MNTAQRERFENWCSREGIPITVRGGMYKDDRAFSAWEAWQAAEAQQQARIDELLEQLTIADNSLQQSGIYIASVKDALSKAGAA